MLPPSWRCSGGEERPWGEVRMRVDPHVGDLGELAARIRRHESVDAVLYDPATGHLIVRYDTRRGTARLLRGVLCDCMKLAKPALPATPPVLRLTVGHELEGRLRLRMGEAPP